MNSLQLHWQLTQQFQLIGLKATATERKNLALLCQTLAFSPNCHLATLALGLPLTGKRENLIQHLRRTLKDQGLNPTDCYQPCAKYLLAHWTDCEVSLVMDRTDIENRWSVLTLGLAHRKRLVPLAWDVLPFGATSGDEQCTLLKRVQPALPDATHVRICFLRRQRVSRRASPTTLPAVRLALASRTQVGFALSPTAAAVASLARFEPATGRALLPVGGVSDTRTSIRPSQSDGGLGRSPRPASLLGTRLTG